jgi:uncharacterized membrane protein
MDVGWHGCNGYFLYRVVAIIIWAIGGFSGRVSGTTSSSSLDIAKARYAKGEIIKEQYDQIKKSLL